jgi:hypothetical protein
MFPKLNPPLSDKQITKAIEKAFERATKNKQGDVIEQPDSAESLVELCLKHLRDRTDPILTTSFYADVKAAEVFEMDAIPHEMQRYRMKLGSFYQFLLEELITIASDQTDSPFMGAATGGPREGDVIAYMEPDSFEKGLKLYISVKKSGDTIGGQDKAGAVRRLEQVAKEDQSRTSPYLCVFAIMTPKGKVRKYKEDRKRLRDNKQRYVSENSEDWGPGFVYPFVTGRSAYDIYNEAGKVVKEYFPFYSVQFKKEASELLKDELVKRGIADENGDVVTDQLFRYITHEID